MAWGSGPGLGVRAPGCRVRIGFRGSELESGDQDQGQDRDFSVWGQDRGIGVRGWDPGVKVQSQDWRLEALGCRVWMGGVGAPGTGWGSEVSDLVAGLSGHPWSSQGAERSLL